MFAYFQNVKLLKQFMTASESHVFDVTKTGKFNLITPKSQFLILCTVVAKSLSAKSVGIYNRNKLIGCLGKM